MKKYLRFLVLPVVCVSVIAGVVLFALAGYYRSHFPMNTWINGVYCTGKTVEEVNQELKEVYEASVVIITDANRAYRDETSKNWDESLGESSEEFPGEISMDRAGIAPDYEESLKNYLNSGGEHSLWSLLKGGSDIQMEPDVFIFDESKLRQALAETIPVVAEQSIPVGVSVYYSEGEYFLYDGNENRLDVDVLYEALVLALEAGETHLSLDEVNCYHDLEDDEADIAQRDLWDRLQRYADCKLVYDMGAEQIEITPQVAFYFLKKDASGLPVEENGAFVLEEEAVNAWVDELCLKYNTSGLIREFQSTRGDIVKVPYVKYGTELNGDAEKEYLFAALTEERTVTEVHVPTYIQQGFVRGLDDIGGTYVEIDMTQQKMYYYKDGALMLQTDVVTGDVRDDMETPEGINYVYNKQRNRTLRGPGYASFVKYWMPVIGGVGIHDASWRSKFGGEIYIKDGSHGCINTPSEIMDDFYEAIEVGTPVIMFY